MPTFAGVALAGVADEVIDRLSTLRFWHVEARHTEQHPFSLD